MHFFTQVVDLRSTSPRSPLDVAMRWTVVSRVTTCCCTMQAEVLPSTDLWGQLESEEEEESSEEEDGGSGAEDVNDDDNASGSVTPSGYVAHVSRVALRTANSTRLASSTSHCKGHSRPLRGLAMRDVLVTSVTCYVHTTFNPAS
jgi:hypothetical protein